MLTDHLIAEIMGDRLPYNQLGAFTGLRKLEFSGNPLDKNVG
jgi:hypothetical protein